MYNVQKQNNRLNRRHNVINTENEEFLSRAKHELDVVTKEGFMISFAQASVTICPLQIIRNGEAIVFWVTKEWLLFTIEWCPALHY